MREDLGRNNLVSEFLSTLKGKIRESFEKVEFSGSENRNGCIRCKIIPGNGKAISLDFLYEQFADFYAKERNCTVALEEFPGDKKKGIPVSIEGLYVVCDKKTIYLHMEIIDYNQLELNAWLRD